ncbi:MAG: efflux RND transporter permease subunit [Synergistales bacterium]|nr:efflux RND transporter permease subunit [Synergistales bacterium]
MKITDKALQRPVTVLIAMIALILFGAFTLTKMNMARMPDIDFPAVAITTVLRGATPTVIDNDVTDVIEEEVNTISGIENLTSYSYEGRSVIAVEFQLGEDIDAAAADVRDKVNLAQANLPDDAEAPIIQKVNPMDSAIVTLAVTGDGSYQRKSDFVDNVAKPSLQTVRHVGNVDTPGFREREIRIWIDPTKLEARGLIVDDVKDAIRNKHVELPAGSIETERHEYDIRLEAEYDSAETLRELPIVARQGSVIRLEDVARVEDGYEDKDSIATYNGRETILLQVKKQRGANEVALAEGILEEVDRIRNQAPEGVSLQVISNTATFVKQSMGGVRNDLFLGVALCSLVMLIFLQTIRATFVTIVAIPVALLGSLLILHANGITINNLSMLGLSLSVGMVIDSTTVVLENIHRHMELGESPLSAASMGTSEVAFAVLAGVATTVAVFGPIATMGGIIGRIFYAFGVTVVTTILISLAVSLTLTPFLSSRLLRRDNPGALARIAEKLLGRLTAGYRWLLTVATRHRIVTMGVAIAVFATGIYLAGHLGTGFTPTEDRGDFFVEIELPNDSSTEECLRMARELSAVVRENPYVDYTFTTLGSGMGSEIYKGQINTYLIAKDKRPGYEEIMQQLRGSLAVYRNVDFTLGDFGGADVDLTLLGNDTYQLAAITDKMKEDLAKTGKLVDINTDVRLDKPRLDIDINRGLASDMNVNIRALAQEVQAYFGGVDVGVFKDRGNRYDIRLQAAGAFRDSPESLRNITIRNGKGQLVSTAGLVDAEMDTGPNMIPRYNRQRSITLSANTAQGVATGAGVALVQQTFRKYEPADGSVRVVSTGMSKIMRESFGYLIEAIVIAIILVYMVMAVQFESFLHPLTVMFALPLMTAGAFGALMVTRLDLDIMGMMGIILLIGIVVNNAILLVDFINQRRERGMGKLGAVLDAAPLRLRPILMTALSTSFGMLPIALGLSEGSEFRQPMAVAVIGGLITSTLLTLFVIPTAYLIVDDTVELAKRLPAKVFRKKGKNEQPETAQQRNEIPGRERSGGE